MGDEDQERYIAYTKNDNVRLFSSKRSLFVCYSVIVKQYTVTYMYNISLYNNDVVSLSYGMRRYYISVDSLWICVLCVCLWTCVLCVFTHWAHVLCTLYEHGTSLRINPCTYSVPLHRCLWHCSCSSMYRSSPSLCW